MDRFHRAAAYPYARPDHSYVYDDGATVALDEFPGEVTAGRTPVLAFGSNAAPEQLRRKFGATPDTVIPVIRADLADFDVVYSAHLTAYGAVPATLAPSPGARLQTWVTWLDDAQLAHMHQSEMVARGGVSCGASRGASWGAAVNYAYGELGEIDLKLDAGLGQLTAVGVYLSNHGALRLEDEAVAFDTITATGRTYDSRAMLDVLAAVRDDLSPAAVLAAFIDTAIDDAEARASWTETLRRKAHPLAFPTFRKLV